jgi:uncharacterized SAM-binding protein YcdF (DUF218 family)
LTRPVLRRALLVLAVLVAAWVVAAAVLFGFPPAESGAPAHADVVVMLSGSHERLAKAESLVRRGVAPLLALSSVRRTPDWRAAVRLCAAGRYERARVLCFEATPYSTRGEARTIAALARRHGWRRIVVVTSTYHVTRAKLLLRRCYAGPLWLVGARAPLWRLPQEWAAETGKLVVQSLDRGC